MNKIEHKGLVYNTREGTYDTAVVKEKCYEYEKFEKNDIWLDIGANIGTFACKHSSEVDMIISLEPDVDNFNLLKKNVSDNDITNVVCVNKALVVTKDTKVQLSKNVGINKGMHSLIEKRGRESVEVKAVHVKTILNTYRPNKIKCDIEGYEYELIKYMHNEDLFSNIETFTFEFHKNHLLDKDGSKLKEIKSVLSSNGYKLRTIGKESSWAHLISANK